MKFSRLALVGAASIAVAQPHNHAHRHPARHNGSPVEARDAVTTTTIPGPVVTVYELNGQEVNWNEVEAGINSGKYVLVGDKISTVVQPSTTAAPSTTSSTSVAPTTTSTSSAAPTTSSSAQAAEFLESKIQSTTSTSSTSSAEPTTTSTSSSTTPTSTVESTTSLEASVSSTSSASSSSSTSSSSSSGSGVDSEFPSGTIDCSTFPSDYGAVAADWLGLDGWTGIQQVPDYTSAASVISYIETAISGSSGCTANSFCSYACPAGYQKSQWPSAQGSTGQSIGGLFCNSDGKLELSRTSYKTICTAGVGNVKVSSSLSKNVAVCRTDYPGTESETIALNVAAGSTEEICNPDASTYFTWEGSATSAQYYINPSGYSVEDACQWGSSGTNIGNWAPVNMGVGKGTSGETFISIFPNSPTNPDGVLDFDIAITGDVSGKCTYTSGKYYNNGVESATGCTVAVTGTATFEFS